MSENQLLEQLLENIKQVQQEQKKQGELLTKLDTKFSSHESELDAHKHKVEMLETKTNRAEGVISFLKLFAGFVAGSVLAFGLWVNQEIHRIDNQIIKLEQHHKYGEND